MNKGVRLREDKVEIIKTAFKESFKECDQLWIFGSRVDLDERGGDIDLYIETVCDNYTDACKMRSKFWGLLQDRLGEQKIDIILNYVGASPMGIYKVARDTGIQLI